MATSHEGHCCICQKTTRRFCSRCVLNLGADNNLLPLTFYCSSDCQKDNYSSHKDICYDRRQLFRGAKLLQDVFYSFREIAFDLEMYDVKIEKNELHFYVPMRNPSQGPFYAFPEHLVSNLVDKQALLSYSACSDALRYLFPLTARVLKGITSAENQPEEIFFRIRKSDLKVYRHSDGNNNEENNPPHQVLVVSLKNKEAYVIDLAGAQYRQYQPAMLWDAYAKRIVKVETRKQFGYEAKRNLLQEVRDSMKASVAAGNYMIPDTRVYEVTAEIAKALARGIEEWESRAENTVAAMLRQRENVFKADAKALLTCISSSMRSYMNSWMEQSVPQYRPLLSQFAECESTTEKTPAATGNQEEAADPRNLSDDQLAKLILKGSFGNIHLA